MIYISIIYLILKMDLPELAALILQQQKNQQQQQQQQQQHLNAQILQALKQKEQQDQQRQLLSSFIQLQQKEQAIAQNNYNSVLNSLLANQAGRPAVNHQVVLGNSQLNSSNIHSIAPLLIGNRLPTTAQQIGNTSPPLNNFQAAHFRRPQPTSPRVSASHSFQPQEQNQSHIYQLSQVLKNEKHTNITPPTTIAPRISKNKRPSVNNNTSTSINVINNNNNVSRLPHQGKTQKISKPNTNVVDQAMANYKAMLKASSPTKGCTESPNNTSNGRTTNAVKAEPKAQRRQDHSDMTFRPVSSNSSDKTPEDPIKDIGKLTSKKEPENQQNQKMPRNSPTLMQCHSEDNNRYSGKKHSLEEKTKESTVATLLTLYAQKRKEEQRQSDQTLPTVGPSETKDLTLKDETHAQREKSLWNKDDTKKMASSVSIVNHSAQVKVEDEVPQRVENGSFNEKSEAKHQNLNQDPQTPLCTPLLSNDSYLQDGVSVKQEGTEVRDAKGESVVNCRVQRIDSPSVVSQSSSSSANNSTCVKDKKDETRDLADHEVSYNKSKDEKSNLPTNNNNNTTRPFGYQNPFQTISSEQIEKSIPENASSVFHVFDRRINLDAHPPGTTPYSLMRSWVKDDPYRAIPQHDLHTLAEASTMTRDQNSYLKIDSRRKPYKKRKITITEDDEPSQSNVSSNCDLISEFRDKTTETNEGITSISHQKPEISDLLQHHINAAKLQKQGECKKVTARMNQHRESLSKIGINLPK